MRRFLIIAHRGASAVAPENTLPAIEAAIDAGADAVELDLQATADGEVVAMHDDNVDRTTDGFGAIASMPLSEVRRLDAGSWFGPEHVGTRIPTLAEALDTCMGRIDAVLEVKRAGAGIEDRVAAVIRDRGASRATVSSRHRNVLCRMRQVSPGTGTTWITYVWDWWPWLAWTRRRAERIGVDRIAIPGARVTARMVRYFADRFTVRGWGVGTDEALAARLIRAGVDGMTFDDPARLKGILERERS